MSPVSPETIQLWGGSLCLDFVNSVDYDADDRPLPAHEALAAPADLARWARRLGVSRGRRLLRVDADELAAARELRAALYAVLAAAARDERPPAAALGHVAAVHAEAAAHAELAATDAAGGRAWRMTWPAGDPRRVRFAVAADAVALLADPERLGRLRRCPGRDCGWLFLDTSGRRRWCSMGACGSREKMRRMYARQRAAHSP
jgi:SARP family transcriptional regulator, regulator of embCAB operon